MKLKHLVIAAVVLLAVNLTLDLIGWTRAASWVTALLVITVLAAVVWLIVRAVRSRRRTGNVDLRVR